MRKSVVACLSSALCLSMMFLTSCGGTEQPSPQKVFLDEPVEVKPVTSASTSDSTSDFTPATTGIGEAFVVPNRTDDLAALAGTNIITFFFSNPNVGPGSGMVSVFEKGSSNSVASINTSNPESVAFSEISDYGKSVTGWTSGRQADIYLPVALDASKEYFVLLEKNAFSALSVQSAAVLDSNIITFSTKAYGLGKTVLPDRVNKGTSIDIPVIIGTGAVSASIEKKTGEFRVSPTSALTSSGNFSVTFTEPGNIEFSVVFKSAAGAVVDTVPVRITVL